MGLRFKPPQNLFKPFGLIVSCENYRNKIIHNKTFCTDATIYIFYNDKYNCFAGISTFYEIIMLFLISIYHLNNTNLKRLIIICLIFMTLLLPFFFLFLTFHSSFKNMLPCSIF